MHNIFKRKTIYLALLAVVICALGYFSSDIIFYEVEDPLARASLSINSDTENFTYFSYDNDEIILNDYDADNTKIYGLTVSGEVQLEATEINGFTEDYMGSFYAVSSALQGDINGDGVAELIFPSAKTDMEYTQAYSSFPNTFLSENLPFEVAFEDKSNFLFYYNGEPVSNGVVYALDDSGNPVEFKTDENGYIDGLSYNDARYGVTFIFCPNSQATYISHYIVEDNTLFTARFFEAMTPFFIVLGISILCIILDILIRRKMYKDKNMPVGKTEIATFAPKKLKFKLNFMSVRWIVMILSFVLIIYGGRLFGSYVGSVYIPTFACPYNTDQLVDAHCYYFANLELLFGMPLTDILLFFGSFIVFAVLLGRVFCGFICPLGFLQDIAHEARQALHIEGISLNERLYAILRFIKWIVLTLFIGLSFVGGNFCDFCPAVTVSPLFNGMKLSLFFSGFAMVLVLVSAFFKRRTFCNICPMGYILGLCHKISLFKLKKDCTACTECGACYEACPMGIKSIFTEREKEDITTTDCLMCGECVRRCPENNALSITFCGKKVYNATRKDFIEEYAEGKNEQ